MKGPWTALLGIAIVFGVAPLAQAVVVFSCTVSTTPISFGTYNPLSAGGDASTGSWSVICTATGSGSAVPCSCRMR